MQPETVLRQCVRAVNNALRPLDAALAPSPAADAPPPLFILGAPRSGSTLTYQLVTQHFQVSYMTAPLGYAYGMIHTLSRLMRPWLGRPRAVYESHYGRTPGLFAPSEHANYWFQWFTEDAQLGHYCDPQSVDPAACADLRRSLATLATITGRPWVFKNLYLGMCAGALARLLPEARFILVQRDPLLICQSVLCGREQQGGGEWWSVKPPYYRQWLELPPWQQVARQVFYAMEIPRRDLKRHAPGRWQEVDYAELCRDPQATLRQLQEWLAPLGYRSYADSRVPQSFEASGTLRLEPALAEQIRAEFDRLHREFAPGGD